MEFAIWRSAGDLPKPFSLVQVQKGEVAVILVILIFESVKCIFSLYFPSWETAKMVK